MRRLLVLFALLALSGLSGQALAGEKVTYSLYYKWGAVNAEVGRAFLTTEKVDYSGTPALHIRCNGGTSRLFEKFFRLKEDFQSWVSEDDARPLEFRRDTYENGYEADNRFIYDWPSGVIHANVKRGDRPRVQKDLPLSEGVYDLMAVVPLLRSKDYEKMAPGDFFYVKIAIDEAVYDIRIRYLGKESVKVKKIGTMPSYSIACALLAGDIFDEGKELGVWLSEDERKIPLAINVPLRIGAVKVWYCDYENE